MLMKVRRNSKNLNERDSWQLAIVGGEGHSTIGNFVGSNQAASGNCSEILNSIVCGQTIHGSYTRQERRRLMEILGDHDSLWAHLSKYICVEIRSKD